MNCRAFERRLAENVTRDTVQNFNNENEIQRTALGGLKSHGKKGTVGVKRTGSATLCKNTSYLFYDYPFLELLSPGISLEASNL